MTEEERNILLLWANNMRVKYQIKKENPLIHISENNSIPLVYEIKKRIELKENIRIKKEQLTMGKESSDFLSFIDKDNFIMKHQDQNSDITNTYQIRFNVILSSPKNSCRTYYGDKVVDIQERTYVMCKSGIDPHWTDINLDDKSRISLSFCYFLYKYEIDNLEKLY